MSQTSKISVVLLCVAWIGYSSQATPPAATADFTITISRSGKPDRKLEGQYARSKDGQIREETPGFVIITDPKAQTASILNPATKEATIIKIDPNTVIHRHAGTALSASESTEFDHAVMDGHPVVKKRSAAASDGKTREIWIATDISLPMLVKTSSSTRSTTKAFRNIVLQEPDPTVFKIPQEYKITQKNDDGSCPLPECSSEPAAPPAHPQ